MDIVNQLAIKAKSGDAESFGKIFDILSDSIYRFLAFRVKNKDDAEEMTNQVFLEAWQGINRYDGKRSFKTWVFTIARYTLIDFYRKHRSTVDLEAVTELSDNTDIQADISTQSEVEIALAELNRLPELYQTVLELRFLEELEYSEIAIVTGKTENSVRVIVKRGLDKLRGIMNHELGRTLL